MLSKKTKYAIKALIKLAKEYQNGPILIGDIAETEKIPKKFLEAILLELRNAGILNSKKGKGGGYYLIKNPEDVNLANVIRLFDGPIALLPCVSYKYYERCEECVDEETCGIRNVMSEVREETVRVLKNNSLADIIKREDDLRNGLTTTKPA
ncbi:MAG: RrF2 family transcriptional regulator [Cytophagaceae bacterium]